jgi:DNA-binding beta-propeller fold protein YncE
MRGAISYQQLRGGCTVNHKNTIFTSLPFLGFATALLLGGFAWAQGERPGPSGYHVVKTIVVGGPERYNRLTIDSDARRLYITRENFIQAMNVDSGLIVGTIPDLKGVHSFVLAPALGRGFTTNGGDDTSTMVDLKTLQKIGTAKTGKNPDAAVYDNVTKRVFIMNVGSNDATAVDAASGAVAGTIALGGQPQSPTVDGKGRVFVNIADEGQIVEIDARELTVIHRWPLAPCERPSGLSMDQKNRRLFAVCDDMIMAVMDADSGKVIAIPRIGYGPYVSGFDPDTQLVFSSNGAGTLTVIHEDSPNQFTVLDNVRTDWLARHMAFDQKTKNIYLVSGRNVHGNSRPELQQVPETAFRVLVVGK